MCEVMGVGKCFAFFALLDGKRAAVKSRMHVGQHVGFLLVLVCCTRTGLTSKRGVD